MAKALKRSRDRMGSDKGGVKQAITLRLDPAKFRRLELLAQAESRTPTSYVETALLRDMEAKEEAARVITMLVPDEAAALLPGVLVRTEGESDERYAEWSTLTDKLFAVPDVESGMDFDKAAIVRREFGLDGLKVELPPDFDDPAFSRQILGLHS